MHLLTWIFYPLFLCHPTFLSKCLSIKNYFVSQKNGGRNQNIIEHSNLGYQRWLVVNGLALQGWVSRVWSSLSLVFNQWDSGSSAVCDPQQHKQFLPHYSQMCDSYNHILARYKLLILSCEGLENTMTRMCRSSTSGCMWCSVSNYAITVSKRTWSLMANTTTRGSHTTTTCVPFLSSQVKKPK